MYAALVAASLIAVCGRAARAHDDMPAMSTMNDAVSHHMAMTALRPEHSGDRARADAIVAGARVAMKRWPDVASVEAAGYTKFAPGVSLPIEHYTNNRFAAQAALLGKFDPEHPTSMIFERHGQALTLVGVMYTAGARVPEDKLDSMVPLSIAQWHRHVDLCFPPAGTKIDPFGKFGFGGTIDTKAACDAANGRWSPQVFGWMVHVWPNERDQESIWAVERHDEHGHGSMSM
jgi:hypothetical protein